MNKRNINLDVIRSVAVFSVLSVHFFLNNGFYETKVSGGRMLVAFIMRNAFMICVPLFLLLTGFLMAKKELSKKYYFGIVRTLELYVLTSVLILIFKHFYLGEQFTFLDAIYYITGNGNNGYNGYAWYISMYIGLFLLIPFLNMIWNGLKSKKQKQLLVATLFFLTTVPTIFNAGEKITMMTWWYYIYPFTYYMIGAYIREYQPKINIILGILGLMISVVFFGTFGYWKSHWTLFEWGVYNDWGGIQNVLNGVLVFLILTNMNFEKMPKILKEIIVRISKLSLGIYLISYIFDNCFYPKLNEAVHSMPKRIEYYFVLVPLVFVCSTIASQLINWVIDAINYIVRMIRNKVKVSKVNN